MNNKRQLIIGGIVILFLLAGGVYLVMSSKKTPVQEQTTTQDQTVQTLSAKEIGLQLIPSSDNKKIKVVVSKVNDIKSLEYDITYEADIPASELARGEQGGKVERGFNDSAENISAGKYESKYFDLGSCSKNVCRYDTGVEEIKIILKVIKKDNKVYKVEDSIRL